MTGPGDGHNGQKMVDAQKSQDTAAGDLNWCTGGRGVTEMVPHENPSSGPDVWSM